MSKTNSRDYKKLAEQLEKIIALMPGHVYWKDTNGILQGCNNEQAKSLGLNSRSEIVGLTAYDFLPKDFANTVTSIDNEVITTGISKTVEEILTLPNGEKSIWLSKKVPLHDNDGQIVGILGISFDISEQKQLEKELSETQQKLEGMTIVSASIAHELRTPFASLGICSEVINEFFPALIEIYKRTSEAKLDSHCINARAINRLKEIPKIMLRETQGANTFINMLLTNLNPNLDDSSEIFSIADCVKEALERYPFKPQQRKWIRWQTDTDFQVKGKPTLIVYILFNLLKNALFYIRQDGSDYIEIKLESEGVYNKLLFMDTGAGISPEALPYIFDRFYSRTHNSSGTCQSRICYY